MVEVTRLRQDLDLVNGVQRRLVALGTHMLRFGLPRVVGAVDDGMMVPGGDGPPHPHPSDPPFVWRCVMRLLGVCMR